MDLLRMPQKYRLNTSISSFCRVKNQKLTIGERATSVVYLIYLGDVANADVVQEIENRICRIKTDAVLGIGELSNFTKDQNWSPFPQAYLSERPDAISNHILDGKVAVLMDRSPGAMIVPMNLIGFFKPQMTIIYIGSLHRFSFITICRIYYSDFYQHFI